MKAQIFNWHGWVKETAPAVLQNKYRNALEQSGFHVLRIVEYFFEPYGYTALFLLSESHFAIHTFPEEGKTYLELSSCIEQQFQYFMTHYTEGTDAE